MMQLRKMDRCGRKEMRPLGKERGWVVGKGERARPSLLEWLRLQGDEVLILLRPSKNSHPSLTLA